MDTQLACVLYRCINCVVFLFFFQENTCPSLRVDCLDTGPGGLIHESRHESENNPVRTMVFCSRRIRSFRRDYRRTMTIAVGVKSSRVFIFRCYILFIYFFLCRPSRSCTEMRFIFLRTYIYFFSVSSQNA